jgi:hypothetical protein
MRIPFIPPHMPSMFLISQFLDWAKAYHISPRDRIDNFLASRVHVTLRQRRCSYRSKMSTVFASAAAAAHQFLADRLS